MAGFEVKRMKQYLLTGVSYAIPFVACGGILIAFALAFAPRGANGAPDPSGIPWLNTVLNIGVSAFTLLVPVLAGYIAYGIADRPGLVPGFVGGYIATHLHEIPSKVAGTDGTWVTAGFLGGLLAGLLAGFIALTLKNLKVPKYIRPIMPIMVIPVVSSLVVGFVMYNIVGIPVAAATDHVSAWLSRMGEGNQIVLALILGGMIAFDMGGPINKAAFFFSATLIADKIHPNFLPMGACATAICIPPIGLGLATLFGKNLWSETEREAGIASLAMGMIGITEGAIPFAAGDPIRIIPTIMIGSMVGAVIAMIGKVGDHAPHGGPIVLPVVDNRIMFLLAIGVGSLTVALISNMLRKISATKEAAQVPAGTEVKV